MSSIRISLRIYEDVSQEWIGARGQIDIDLENEVCMRQSAFLKLNHVYMVYGAINVFDLGQKQMQSGLHMVRRMSEEAKSV
jgi:hypothetical protein